MKIAMSHFEIGTCVSANEVPTVAVNFLRQAPQKYIPARILCCEPGFDVSLEIAFASPSFLQCGQIGLPPGQRSDSNSFRALRSLEYSFASETRFRSSASNFVFMLTKCDTKCRLCQIKSDTKCMITETKMGRPTLPTKEKRGKFLSTRVSPPEYGEIHAAIRASGEAKTEWIRKKLLAAARRA